MKNKFEVPYIRLDIDWKKQKSKLIPVIDNVLSSGQYIGGDIVNKFEKNIAKFCDCKFAVALNSGTDALTLGMHILGIGRGDEVITTPNSFVASTATIAHLGAKPIFVDVLNNQNIDPNKIESVITKNTKAIMAVHLTGRVAQMDQIKKIAKKYNLYVIEDAAQSIGSKFKGKKAGSFGDIGCFSTHPLKNLNALGDGGFITTNSKKIYNLASMLRNHGQKTRDNILEFGYVSRMDALQAAVLDYKLKNLEEVIKLRRNNAKIYFDNINNDHVDLPLEEKFEFNTYHTFVIQVKQRNALKKYLEKNGIETAIHYPTPIHLQPSAKRFGYTKGSFKIAEKQSKKILTLPINQYLKRKEIDLVIKHINHFYN